MPQTDGRRIIVHFLGSVDSHVELKCLALLFQIFGNLYRIFVFLLINTDFYSIALTDT